MSKTTKVYLVLIVDKNPDGSIKGIESWDYDTKEDAQYHIGRFIRWDWEHMKEVSPLVKTTDTYEYDYEWLDGKGHKKYIIEEREF